MVAGTVVEGTVAAAKRDALGARQEVAWEVVDPPMPCSNARSGAGVHLAPVAFVRTSLFPQALVHCSLRRQTKSTGSVIY
mmetsp:Transcript_10232/g.23957  ORF Transcript_10232/g.23957 Transcript_10232/m.23957 type:complete len:80 (+) Transcript_10232:844-1083(+)